MKKEQIGKRNTEKPLKSMFWLLQKIKTSPVMHAQIQVWKLTISLQIEKHAADTEND